MNTLSPVFTDELSPRTIMFCLDVGDWDSFRMAMSLLVSLRETVASILSPYEFSSKVSLIKYRHDMLATNVVTMENPDNTLTCQLQLVFS